MTTWQNIIEHSPLAMATTEGPEHKLQSVNAAFCALQDKSAEELIGHPLSETISGPGAENVLSLLDRVYAGEKSGFIHNQQRSDLDQRLKHKVYMAWGLPLIDGHKEALVIQVTDVTDQARDKEEIERATEEIRELNREMRQINEQLIISALQQQDLAERNRAIAEALQYSILWREPEKLFDRLKVASFYEPALDDALVGGDFFDAFTLPNGSILLTVGDVTGKGLNAAARTLEVTFAIRAFAQDCKTPADIMTRLNQFICQFHCEDDHLGNALIVLSLIVIDPITGATQAASAGAEPPLMLRVNGAVEEISVHGLMLGIKHDAQYETTNFSLGAGDTLMMTTDGITETRRGRDFFGPERVLETARIADEAGTLQDVGQAVVDAARAHGRGQFSDDVCLLLVRRDHIVSNPV